MIVEWFPLTRPPLLPHGPEIVLGMLVKVLAFDGVAGRDGGAGQ
jgi:hypothetical protein